ncbi:MAG: CDP-diacylglycerol--serine O-phosphatidyltransferase [Odoribacter sp.]|nr:CDP-diacylglycerol--serine O-phosphatidyltransferase [Odoribacter sp.]
MRHIPNFITSLNLASGFISIVFILNGDIITASWLILAAMIFDFLDGFAARALKAYSDIGKELDSLADVVSFGVAPGLIIYHLLYAALWPENQAGFHVTGFASLTFLIIPAVMPVCAALRLAIFNIDTTQTTSFKGLPTPANGLAVISMVLGGYYSGSAFFASLMASPISLIILSLSLSGLMVTRIPLLSLKFRSFKIKGNEGRYILIIVCAGMISVFGIGSIPWIIPVYIIVSLFSLVF